MTRNYREGDDPRLTCDAIIGQRAGTYGFEYVFCGQVVGVSSYWIKRTPLQPSDIIVSYCSIEGHESNVRRRFAEQVVEIVDPPMPVFLHEDPDFIDHDPDERYAPDPIDQYKSWTDAGGTEAELREAFSG